MFRTKDTSLPIKDFDFKTGTVVLYASAFGNKDSDGDIIVPGAFKKTIMERGPEGSNRIKHLWQHSSWEPMGRPLKMEEDDMGLRIDSFVSNSRNGDYRKMYQEGIITEHSIGFEPIKEDQQEEANFITEAKLWEYSSVTWGANANTPVVDLKSMDKQSVLSKVNGRMNKFIKFIRNSDATDETLQMVELELKYLQSIYNSLVAKQPGSKSTEEQEPNNEQEGKSFKLEGNTLATLFKSLNSDGTGNSKEGARISA